MRVSSWQEEAKESESKECTPTKDHIGIEDFVLLEVIGRASFGRVMKVTMKETDSKVYAMKILNKGTIIAHNGVEHTLMKLQHPFLAKLYYFFQTSNKFYFVRDYIDGRELFFYLQKERRFSEERVRFYAAEILAGVEYLHTYEVIYHNLTPENLLLTREGHIVMTDFGLHKFKEGFSGTPEYLAPEVLEGEEYSTAVVWWSFGTVIYEMLTGLLPFYSEHVQEMYSRILTAELKIPSFVSPDATDLLVRLLDRNHETRFQEPAEIKLHRFFKSIDWELLLEKKITPPYIPDVRTTNYSRDGEFAPLDVEDTPQGEFEALFTYQVPL
eukprot:TRINITY_DN13869_c0_g2_i1.p1 TRINITY_DN13869_c0_g2~~TRINITY_DN13869_c0_g2_i1.p1  ORF type:complete len:327 (-),score=84.70 TRINITY_DN13869_c0_g2_i1:61-1041(-)